MSGYDLAGLLTELAAWITEEAEAEPAPRHRVCWTFSRRNFDVSRAPYRHPCAAHPRPVVAPVPRGLLR